jgi:hypothetical protein
MFRHSFSRFACCFAVLIAASSGIFLFAQEAASKAPDRWSMMPVSSSELRTLIAKSQLVAQATVLQHTTKSENSIHLEHTSLRLDKLFRGSLSAGQTIDLVCICSREYPDLVPGTEIVFFADRNDGVWEPSKASLTYETYYLQSSSWLLSRISERVRKIQ